MDSQLCEMYFYLKPKHDSCKQPISVRLWWIMPLVLLILFSDQVYFSHKAQNVVMGVQQISAEQYVVLGY